MSDLFDTGNNTVVTESEDIKGYNRVNGTVDIGAYEVECTGTEVTNLDDSGIGSLRCIIASANDGDTITFDEDLIASGSATIALESQIAWGDKSLTIKG